MIILLLIKSKVDYFKLLEKYFELYLILHENEQNTYLDELLKVRTYFEELYLIQQLD
jgi:hypothetical protein